MKNRVLFLQLPPVNTHQADIAFTILEGHLGAHGVSSQTIFGNLQLRHFYDRFLALKPDIFTKLVADIETRPTVFYLGPFLLELLAGEDTPRTNQLRGACACPREATPADLDRGYRRRPRSRVRAQDCECGRSFECLRP